MKLTEEVQVIVTKKNNNQRINEKLEKYLNKKEL